MSILQEYERIRKELGEETFSCMEEFLAIHPEYLLSDLYYRESVYEKFKEWKERRSL